MCARGLHVLWLLGLGLLLPVLLHGEPPEFYLVDARTGAKLGPFQAADGAPVKIGDREFRYLERSPLNGLEHVIIAELAAKDASPEVILGTAWKMARAQAGKPLPDLVFFQMDKAPKITVEIGRMSLPDLFRYVCGACQVRVVWGLESEGPKPIALVVVEPVSLPRGGVVQHYRLAATIYEDMVKNHGTVAAALVEYGAVQRESASFVIPTMK